MPPLSDDFFNISKIVRDYIFINEVNITSKEHYLKLFNVAKKETKAMPLFLKDKGRSNSHHHIE